MARRKGLVPIYNQGAFGKALAGIRRRFGSQARAANAIGVSQAQFSKLRNGRYGAVTRATYDRLCGVAPLHRDRDMRLAFAAPETDAAARGYEAWLIASRRGLLVGNGEEHERGPGGIRPIRPQPTRRRRAGGAEGIVRTLQALAHADAPGALRRFRKEHVRRGHDANRVALSIIRIFAPFLDTTRSAFIERSWAELTARERKSFIAAGIRRERILLRRAVDSDRIQEIAGLDAGEFARRSGRETMSHLS